MRESAPPLATVGALLFTMELRGLMWYLHVSLSHLPERCYSPLDDGPLRPYGRRYMVALGLLCHT